MSQIDLLEVGNGPHSTEKRWEILCLIPSPEVEVAIRLVSLPKNQKLLYVRLGQGDIGNGDTLLHNQRYLGKHATRSPAQLSAWGFQLVSDLNLTSRLHLYGRLVAGDTLPLPVWHFDPRVGESFIGI